MENTKELPEGWYWIQLDEGDDLIPAWYQGEDDPVFLPGGMGDSSSMGIEFDDVQHISPRFEAPSPNRKTETIRLDSIKDSDGWHSLAHTLLFDRFKQDNSDLDEDELSDKFYEEVVTKNFEYGEYANLEIEFDDKLNIVGGRVVKQK